MELEGKVCDEPGREVPATAAIAFHPGRPARYRVRARVAALLEDDDFVIVDKPAGVLTVPTAERESDTLLARIVRLGRLPPQIPVSPGARVEEVRMVSVAADPAKAVR